MQVIDETEADLRALIAADFGSLEPIQDFNTLLLDWLHYQARRIPIRPRQVFYSPQTSAFRLSHPAIDLIARDLRHGADMTPWLSDRIRLQKSKHKADLMFNDWQIVHFHTNPLFVSQTKTKRAGALLFARIESDAAYLLDVQAHGSWASATLLEILLDVCPEMMARRELKGVLSPRSSYSEKDQELLRGAGVTSMIMIRGRPFIAPGMGVSTSGHSTRLVLRMQQLLRSIRTVREQIHSTKMEPALQRALTQKLGLPARLGISLFQSVLRLYEKNRGIVLTEFACLE